MRFRTLALTFGALTTALVLAGCTAGSGDMSGMDHGSDAPSSAAATDAAVEANAADRMFAMMMIPHHQQAVEMADLILGKEGIDDRVVALAQRIKDAQGPEIVMKGWLQDWGTPYDDSMAGHDMGMDDGMLSEEEMAELASATGVEATRLFLTGMIAHHEGAVAMAQVVIAGGQDPKVIELAQQVIDGQSAEISEMNEILATL